MASITRLCSRAILLDQGQIVADGPSHHVVHNYMNRGGCMTSTREWLNPSQAPQGDTVRLLAVRVRTEDGKTAEIIDIRRPVLIEMEYAVLRSGDLLLPHYDLYNEEGILIFGTVDVDPGWRQKPRWEGNWISTVLIPGNLLSEGRVSVAVGMTTTRPEIQQFYERDVVAFQVTDCLSGDSARGDWSGPFDGVVRPLLKWNTEYKPNVQDSSRVRTLFG
jgi:lipopolysaccharide transport system ATP-binding protein